MNPQNHTSTVDDTTIPSHFSFAQAFLVEVEWNFVLSYQEKGFCLALNYWDPLMNVTKNLDVFLGALLDWLVRIRSYPHRHALDYC